MPHDCAGRRLSQSATGRPAAQGPGGAIKARARSRVTRPPAFPAPNHGKPETAQPGTTVTLSYRSNAFSRVKPKNRDRLDQAIANQRVQVILESTVKEITPDQVMLKKGEEMIALPNQAIIVCAGGELPTPMLKKIGIQVEAHYGT